MHCKVCGKAFATKLRSAKYCSDACRAEATRRYNRECMRRYLADPEKRAIILARTRAAAAARRARERGGHPPKARRSAGRAAPAAAPKSDTCRLCGRSFAQYGGASHAYCKRCTAKADRAIAKALRVDCKTCGKAFSTTNRSVRYCSDACRAEGQRRGKRELNRKRMADPERRAIARAHMRAWSAARRGGKAGRPKRRQA